MKNEPTPPAARDEVDGEVDDDDGPSEAEGSRPAAGHSTTRLGSAVLRRADYRLLPARRTAVGGAGGALLTAELSPLAELHQRPLFARLRTVRRRPSLLLLRFFFLPTLDAKGKKFKKKK